MKEAGRDYKTKEMRAKGKDLWAKIARNKKMKPKECQVTSNVKKRGTVKEEGSALAGQSPGCWARAGRRFKVARASELSSHNGRPRSVPKALWWQSQVWCVHLCG